MRDLRRDEIPLIWTIDRSEFIENIYRLQDGELVLEPHHFRVPGWPPGKPEKDTPAFAACHDRGGRFRASFDGDHLIGVAIVDVLRVGAAGDLVQLEFLHVSRAYRKRSLGAALFNWALDVARELDAAGLYVSATPSENTVHFYQGQGCALAAVPDARLFELEPEDIHFERRL